jgi:hypothetical protein
MSEINIEIEKERAVSLLPSRQVLKCLRNGKVGDVAFETILILIKQAEQVGFNAQGQAYAMGLSLWARHAQGGTIYIETDQNAVDGLSLSLGVDLPN